MQYMDPKDWSACFLLLLFFFNIYANKVPHGSRTCSTESYRVKKLAVFLKQMKNRKKLGNIGNSCLADDFFFLFYKNIFPKVNLVVRGIKIDLMLIIVEY